MCAAFLADVMMRKAARWLRLLGQRVDVPESEEDAYLVGYAKAHDLILLTRDEELIERAKRHGVKAYFVRNIPNYKQVAEIVREFGLQINFPAEMFCPKCNGGFMEVGKTEANGNVPARVYEAQENFWRCKQCGQFYWQGSHWKRIENEAEKIKNELAEKN